ncbi:MAG: hypothetical protein IT427_16415 [Pirellulales bacterium]|nr:hypothetical protein [Pirellulales bacterium]
MWRAFFLAIGLFLLVVGAECLLIDQATISNAESGVVTVVPPEWVPWSLMSAGAITMLYSFTLPKKFSGS